MARPSAPEERLQVLSRATQQFLEATDDVDGLFHVVASEVTRVLGDSCGLWVLDDAHENLTCVAVEACDDVTTAEDRALYIEPISLTENPGQRSVALDGREVLVKRFDPETMRPPVASERFYEHVKRRGIHSLLRVPLRAKHEPIGFLAISRFRRESPPFDEQDMVLARALADHAALAVLKARDRSAADAARREAEIAREELKAALAAHLQAVTARQSLEEQLRQAQKMEAIGQLAGGVAHDFNNLLSVILTYSSLMKESMPAEDPHRAEVEEIRRAGERAAGLTRQLLAFSRRQMLQPRDIDINSVVGEMMTMLRRLVPENIELSFTPAAGLAASHVDPSQLSQVLMNLVVNARDAIVQKGSIHISTSAVDVDAAFSADHLDVTPGRYSVLELSDTGVGMDKATQARVFEPFFTTKEVGKGTGLGLSTAFGIVKQSGGSIWCSSELGRGTTFKVYLPASSRPAPAAEAPKTTRVGGDETILLVEDEEQVRRLAKTVLERAGYSVLVAASGAEALALATAHVGEIHLLLTDVVMPGMSGREVAEALVLTRPSVKPLFMSGYTDDAVVQQDGVSFLQKPLLPTSLLEGIRAALLR